MVFWGSVAIKAPFHIEGILFHHKGHLIDLAMTALTTNAFAYMDAMVEVDKIG